MSAEQEQQLATSDPTAIPAPEHDPVHLQREDALESGRAASALERAAHWNHSFIYAGIAALLCLGIALSIYGRYLFDSGVPSQGDVRAHIFKIDMVHYYLSQFSWPQWVPYWYEGIPMNQYYPPGFYFLGAVLTFIFGSSVIAYKLMVAFTLAACGGATYFFARRFLKLDPRLALVCLLAYTLSMPLLLNFAMGEGPNLLGWAASLAFLAVYLGNVADGRTAGLRNRLWPGLLLGLSILIHPFPTLFAVLAVAVFHVIRLFHLHSWRNDVGSQFGYPAAVIAIAAVIGAYYWVPMLHTLQYASPIYALTSFNWVGGTKYLMAISVLALSTGLMVRLRTRDGLRLDFLMACLLLAVALGAGAGRHLPLGLGGFLQEFRFDTIVGPFFGIVLVVFALRYGTEKGVSTANLALAIVTGIILAAGAFALDNRSAIKEDARLVPLFTSAESLQFLLAIAPYFIVLLFLVLQAYSTRKDAPASDVRPTSVLAAGACLLLLSSAVPYVQTYQALGMGRLFEYTSNYLEPEYAQTMEAASGGRMLVPMVMGYLSEGDSPVTFGWRWNVETVNGPYNQGDPKFFQHTVHLEWEERWLKYPTTRENLMQEAAAKYIFVRSIAWPPDDMTGLTVAASNSYASLLALDQPVHRAVAVTPILLDAQDPKWVTEFFNILLPGGYRTVLVNVQDVPADLRDKFQYVMVDDPAKLADYSGKTAFLLQDSGRFAITEEGSYIRVEAPYYAFTSRLFYHGDEADGYWWVGVDFFDGSHPTREDIGFLDYAGWWWSMYSDRLEYQAATYQLSDNRIVLGTRPGFTLVKDSYFPYWKTDQGQVVPTSQGFMLVYSDSPDADIRYRMPLVDVAAVVLTLGGLAAVTALLIAGLRRRRPI